MSYIFGYTNNKNGLLGNLRNNFTFEGLSGDKIFWFTFEIRKHFENTFI